MPRGHKLPVTMIDFKIADMSKDRLHAEFCNLWNYVQGFLEFEFREGNLSHHITTVKLKAFTDMFPEPQTLREALLSGLPFQREQLRTNNTRLREEWSRYFRIELKRVKEQNEVHGEDVGFVCRHHPTDGYHEVGCSHQFWSSDDLLRALVTKKQSERSLGMRLFRAESELTRLREAVEKAKAVIGFYADANHWHYDSDGKHEFAGDFGKGTNLRTIIEEDEGKVAIAFLTSPEKPEDK